MVRIGTRHSTTRKERQKVNKAMKTSVFLLTVLLALAFCSLANAQVDMKHGQDSDTQLRLGTYLHDADGNQDWVREYDGRSFGFGLESLSSYGYSNSLAYWLEMTDVVNHNEAIDFQMALRNQLTLNLSTDAMTHRLARPSAVDPFLAGTPAAGGNTFKDLVPGLHGDMDRRVDNAEIALTPCKDQQIRLVGGWWQETEKGLAPILFRARVIPGQPAFPAGIISGDRLGGAVVLDRNTTENKFGTDVAVGSRSALSYRFTDTRFRDHGLPVAASDFPGLSAIIQPNTETRTNVFKARSKLSNRLYFTGVQTSRNRDNKTSTLDVTGVALPRTNRVEIDATNVALNFLATNSLNFTGRYRKYSLDNRVPPVLVGGIADNQAVSRDESSYSLEGSFTGIRRAFLSGGYERLDVDRSASALHANHPEFEHPFTARDTDTHIWRLGARYYPTDKLSMSGNWEKRNINDPVYAGSPTDRDNLNVEATYMVQENFAIYGNFYRWNERNDQIRVPLADVPTPAVDAAGQSLREDAAGQQYKNNMSTGLLGAWFALNSKLTLDANVSRVKTNSRSTLIFGTDPAFLPQLFPDLAPYDATDNQWSLGLTYAFRPKWRVYTRYMNSNSDGKTILDLTTSAGAPLPVGPTWTPVSIDEHRYTVGLGCSLSASEDLLLELSRADWADQIDSSQSGQFNLIRLAWEHRY
jgi:predicted porin